MTTVSTAALVRPNDATAYAVADAVSNSTTAAAALVFSDCALLPGKTGVIVTATMIDSVAAATAPMFDLYLFDRPVGGQLDNAAFALADADAVNCLGVLTFDGPSYQHAGTLNTIVTLSGINLPFRCLQNLQSLYGLVVARNAYTPAAFEVFTFRLGILQD